MILQRPARRDVAGCVGLEQVPRMRQMALEAALDASVALARIIKAHAAVRAGYAEAIARLAARGALLHVPIHWDSVASDRDAADRR